MIDSGRPKCGLPASDAALAARRRSAVKTAPVGRLFLRSDGNSKKSEVFPSLSQKARDAAPTPPEKSKKKPRPGRAGAGTE